jgi:hypothetical protein
VTDLFDALIPVDPEPCDTCDTGICYMHCWDRKRRCRNCVQELARKFGWDKFELEWDWDSKKTTSVHEAQRISIPKQEPKLDL